MTRIFADEKQNEFGIIGVNPLYPRNPRLVRQFQETDEVLEVNP
jgi:hypothetical protein